MLANTTKEIEEIQKWEDNRKQILHNITKAEGKIEGAKLCIKFLEDNHPNNIFLNTLQTYLPVQIEKIGVAPSPKDRNYKQYLQCQEGLAKALERKSKIEAEIAKVDQKIAEINTLLGIATASFKD